MHAGPLFRQVSPLPRQGLQYGSSVPHSDILSLSPGGQGAIPVTYEAEQLWGGPLPGSQRPTSVFLEVMLPHSWCLLSLPFALQPTLSGQTDPFHPPMPEDPLLNSMLIAKHYHAISPGFVTPPKTGPILWHANCSMR